ncbi:YPDG domain-containing protein, partial [Corynebacterium sp. HMSC034B08]|uniref:YPDG domain-containing protein n=1 Tax=Corynebacterium sp. HMSC034B08 TaxID=1715135 RepID=UPI000A6DAB73
MKKNYIARRRGTSVAAAALSFALVAPLAQPVAFAQEAPAAVAGADAAKPEATAAAGEPYADAIYSPGVVNGKKTVSGTVLFYDQFPGSSIGNTAAKGDFGKALPAAGSGLGENFKGATVYAQWFEKPAKGKTGDNPAVASPVYKTTVNEDGTYAINMRPYIDSDGKYREFHAQYNTAAGGRGQKVKIWVDGYDRDEYEMVRGYGERQVPDGTVADDTGGAGWGSGPAQRSLAGAHQVFVKRANAEQMLGDESEWRKVDDIEKAANGKEGGSFYGKAYWNLNQGLGGLGQKEIVGDKNDRRIEGLQVVAAYLSDKAVLEIQKHVEENKGTEYQNHDLRSSSWDVNDELKLQAWINEQIAKNPDWIAERVVTETDGNGDYLIQFKGTYGINPNKAGKVDPKLAGTVADSFADGVFTNNQISGRENAKHVNWDWLFVDAPNLPTGVSNMGAWRGNVWQGLTSNPWGIADIGGVAGTPYDMRGMQKASLSPNYNVGSWDMALMPKQIHFAVDKYDSLTNFARPGDKTHAFTNGLPGFNLSALYQVEWKDSDGNVVNTCKAVDAEGNLIEGDAAANSLGMPAKSDGTLPNCEITVPEDLDKMTTYTATLYGIDANGDRIALASDSFTALVKTAAEVSPQYDPTFAEVGTEVKTGKPKFVDALTGEPIDPADERLAGAKYVLHKDALPEGWAADIDPETGVITVTPGANGIDGEELKPGDTVNLPVRVEYADGTANGAYAPIVIGKQADFLEPKYEDKLVVPGKETKSKPTFTDKNGKGVDVPKGSKFAIGEDFKAPEGYVVEIDKNTGEITVTFPDGSKLSADTAEEFDVPVTVTYPDKSTDKVKANFKLDTDGDGTPDTEDEDDDGDGIPDEEEKNKGSNPKNKGSIPATPLVPGTKVELPDWDDSSTTPG